ncbi:hypothetical protein PoB_000419800 [Plakobranchus ocellatus]|uniref:Uncharacterized protein n=1 Tax=Plakobranchus ocellatus TaxID=259542 RepID=A0AAV3Y689_9GAST|nr:hypothetical protein PoB_000419800 [Plakobranchus ocellatus]
MDQLGHASSNQNHPLGDNMDLPIFSERFYKQLKHFEGTKIPVSWFHKDLELFDYSREVFFLKSPSSAVKQHWKMTESLQPAAGRSDKSMVTNYKHSTRGTIASI